MLDFRLKTFVTVWEEKSFTKAADKLCITQPAASQHIKNLEARFGTSLFRFVGRQFFLTDAGAILYRYASSAQSEGKKVEALLASQRGIPLRFGATRTIGEYVLPSALAYYLHNHPDAKLSMIVDNTHALLGMLLDGTIDFAFIEGIFDRKAYKTDVFLRDVFLPVCSPHDPLAQGTVELADLLQRRLIVREQGSGSRVILENALAGYNARIEDFHRVLELGNLEAIKGLVSEGLGIAFLYEWSVRKELASGKIMPIHLRNFSISHDYSFVRLKNSIFEQTYQEFLDTVLQSNVKS